MTCKCKKKARYSAVVRRNGEGVGFVFRIALIAECLRCGDMWVRTRGQAQGWGIDGTVAAMLPKGVRREEVEVTYEV